MRAILLLLALLLAPVATSGCLQIDTSTDAGTSAAAPSIAAAATAAESSGTNCARDPATMVELCEQIDTCPGVAVDPGPFPNCGFRPGPGATLDLECLCGSALCPMGVPTSCAQAKQLLDAQTALLVCQQQADGRCVEFGPPDAGSSTCDPICRGECSGDPDCLQLCGC